MTHQTAATDSSAIPAALRGFLRRRAMEAGGLGLIAAAGLLSLALATWSPADPSFSRTGDGVVENALGLPGAYLADELLAQTGLAALLPIAVFILWGMRLLLHRGLDRIWGRVLWLHAALLAAAGLASALPVLSRWPLATGMGGNLGDFLFNTAAFLFGLLMKPAAATVFAAAGLSLAGVFTLMRALAVDAEDVIVAAHVLGERNQRRLATVIGGVGHWRLALTSLWAKLRAANHARRAAPRVRRAAATRDAAGPEKPGLLARLKGRPAAAPPPAAPQSAERREPLLDEQFAPPEAPQDAAAPADDISIGQPDAAFLPDDHEERPAAPAAAGKGVTIKRPGKTACKLPPLDILAKPDRGEPSPEMSDAALAERARMLEGVLEDFGVRGQIVNVCPGPVVTLYELEPAPGIKSSRVIGLADDIARSMSAISVRVAVVPGRNVIGIELPNASRETVYLREMLQGNAYKRSRFQLPLALGKNIAGEPVFADLARMPHLLIAGTTGSGKSVGINTFIMSLLYKMKPDQCRLIMIDPKMLELSIYEGIPHLLSPVVTDPKKAVVALKWAVREMEERYQKMALLGVRNLQGYNERVKEALKKGEVITRSVQTGFDPDTGAPVYEEKALELEPLPYIVVIIDEMADLMMVAGKDIEGAVQRLAQMARAAGIHVIMATQRPSVDVITGTIKANFPTRISFQVTSRIDSRTILGEQGAEQLLGMGDMLYMAGGGRIVRLHGPFVSDAEVEEVVKFLKSQGAPEYVEAVTTELDDAPGGGGAGGGAVGNSGDDLYDRAVQVVLRDKKVSTSYIQRRLQIGYNRAATLIERMEEEGLISAPNSKGRREILVGGDSAQ
ncbi:MAG TPA: cell division protein FtsK [Thermopetrobacter sp.]|nr:cell division protein FtsK [Thermopetrobacter sp.]